jgi:predicted site-specific integrase-resolvase
VKVNLNSSTAPVNPGGFKSEKEILLLVGVSRRTLKSWRERGLIPYVKLPGSRRILFDWDSVKSALMRQQQGAL